MEIRPIRNINVELTVPGSKSLTHRSFILAALADGESRISNALRSEDTQLTVQALQKLGVTIEEEQDDFLVTGTRGELSGSTEIDLGNCGTGMRLLTAVAALARGRSVLTGNERMKQRPIADLISGLQQIGISIQSVFGTGCPPVELYGQRPLEGGRVSMKGDISSQFISALLIIAPLTTQGITLEILGDSVSKPYIDLTIEMMKRFGVSVNREVYSRFFVPGNQTYRSGDYFVEPDVSNASYFWAAAAVTGGSCTIRNINGSSGQGDLQILQCLERMGCKIHYGTNRITVEGERLHALEVDMGDMPDMVPTLAVVAAFAEGTTCIRNIAHLRTKESDRIAAIATELKKMGIQTSSTEDTLQITGGKPHSAIVETYNDHRIAMAFSIVGLKTPGIRILNETCVAKSFPEYWALFESLYGQ